MSRARGNQTLTLGSPGAMTLTVRPDDFVAMGGEGTIYRVGSVVVKLYHDAAKMAQDRIGAKIRALAAIQHPYIISPAIVVRDQAGAEVGFTMPVADGEALSRVITTAWRVRAGFQDPDARTLVERMHEVVQIAHRHGAILVDANELNWKVCFPGKSGPEPRIFDVDSWAIGSWPAKVQMPSIRDWHTKGFTQDTDWFAWGIVTFQVWTGIHPYKGTLPGYKPGDLTTRMQENASVFRPTVSLNQAVRDFKCIPANLLDWYQATFEQGERSIPPSAVSSAGMPVTAQVLRVTTTATGALRYERLLLPDSPPIRIWPCGVVLLADGRLVDLQRKRSIGKLFSRNGEVVKVERGWLIGEAVGGTFGFKFTDETTFTITVLDLTIAAQALFRYGNRLFCVTEHELVEMTFANPGRPLLSTGRRASTLQPKATQWLDGVGIATAFGSTFVVTPFGSQALMTTRVPELDGLKVIDAKAGERFVTVLGVTKAGQYLKTELHFTTNYSHYTAWQGQTDLADLNIAILPRGVCATIVKDGELTVFVPGTKTVTLVKDQMIRTDLLLGAWDNTVIGLDRQSVWSIAMK